MRSIAAAAHFDLKRGDAQTKHSLPTHRAESPMGARRRSCHLCADCVDRDPPARASVRAWGEQQVLGTPRRAVESLHASHAHRVAPRSNSWGTATSPSWG